ncbi:TraM recognition domain-containing protein [Azotobacter sp. CWF10]
MLRKLYYSDIAEAEPNPDIEGLLTMLEHERTHFGKMIAGLLPILVMLTSGRMGPLLSPVKDDEDERPICDLNSVINAAHVLYLGLDALSDPMVGSTIGSLALADLASTAGEIYNHRQPKPVNIFVDEAAEVLNDQLIQLLNKGRGAGINLYIATQTIADFKARMGDEAKALQVLANANHIVAMRVLDTDTQEFIASKMPMSRYQYVMRTQGNSSGEAGVLQSGNVGERLMEEEGNAFPWRCWASCRTWNTWRCSPAATSARDACPSCNSLNPPRPTDPEFLHVYVHCPRYPTTGRPRRAVDHLAALLRSGVALRYPFHQDPAAGRLQPAGHRHGADRGPAALSAHVPAGRGGLRAPEVRPGPPLSGARARRPAPRRRADGPLGPSRLRPVRSHRVPDPNLRSGRACLR